MFLKIYADEGIGYLNYDTNTMGISLNDRFVHITIAHELAHHKLNHNRGCHTKKWNYSNNILRREREAWKYVLDRYNVLGILTEEVIEYAKECLLTYCDDYKKPKAIALSFCRKYKEKIKCT